MGLLRSLAVLFLLSPFLYAANPSCMQDLLEPQPLPPAPAADTAGRDTPDQPSRSDAPPAPPSRTPEASSTGPDSSIDTQPTTEKTFFRSVMYDQKAIWTSPFHLKTNDVKWLVPFGAVAAGLIGSDAHAMQIEKSPAKAITRSNSISNYGAMAMGASVGAFYLFGVVKDRPHPRETGLLSFEAGLDGLIVTEFMKAVTLRDRPDVEDGRGHFLASASPLNGSFPSEHSVAAWSIASVIAHEYPGWFTKVAVYGAAAAISVSRVSGRKHFPSDVVVGAPLGWLIGRQVYRAHHNQDLEGENIGTFSHEGTTSPPVISSTYVPLDSWVYPALLRLAALGYINTQVAGVQPWTRLECERQVQEARKTLEAIDDPPPAIDAMISQLEREFAKEEEAAQGSSELQELAVESVYFRYANISGKPLNDSFHFGQTLINDFGRPYGEGRNVITGLSARAVDGRYFFYFRGEYQHAPGGPAEPLSVRQFIANVDQVPLSSGNPVPSVDRLRLVEGYAGLALGDLSFSFGKQALWWGPTRSGPLVMSDNAEPFYGLRISNMHPFQLPGLLKSLGRIRGEFFFGKLAGHHVPARPYIHGQKISLKVTDNLEVGFSRTVTFAGAGHAPFTLGTFDLSFFSVGDQVAGANAPGRDPGDRHAQFDFSYRVPKLRNWLTLYSDSYADDDPSPLAAPRRAAFNPGFYLSHLPGLPRLDLRAESVYTDLPTGASTNGSFIYWNIVYHNGYTNEHNLLGNWIGREGKGFQVWTTYWHSAQRTMQLGWRNAKISTDFVPGGGTQNDIFGKADWLVRPGLSISGMVQHEAWLIPLLKPGLQHDWTGQIQITFFPKPRKHSRATDGQAP